MMSNPQMASVASDMLQSLKCLPSIVHRISWNPASNAFNVDQGPNEMLPLLTATGGQTELEALLTGFSDWEGILEIRALRCGQGLYDFWIG